MSATLNLCNLPAWIIGSTEFNDNPEPLQIQGLSTADRLLLAQLDEIPEQAERARAFNDYMSVKFYLHQWADQSTAVARRSIKNSYLRFLRGWGVDSNSTEGAVLKGWVESRFGLVPRYHRGSLDTADHDDCSRYAIDRMRGSAHTNNILSQLDLLYSYTQYELARAHPHQKHLRLYRGTYDASEHEVLESRGGRVQVVALNNLCSFTSDREKAWEFGTTVWQVDVPLCKVLFHGDLLPQSILKGENEHLVIGGRYLVRGLL